MSSVLVVDDEPSICWGLSRLGESLGHEVMTASSAEQALEQVARQRPDVVVLDVRLPGMDGLTAIERLQHACGSLPIIVITAYGDLQSAVEAVRRGAYDYIAKPFDVSKIREVLLRALASRSSDESPSAINPPPVEGMIGRSPAMQEVFKQIALAASSHAPVLLSGESGTGKELAARAIHRYSRRSDGPFVAVNVASLSATLAESELFGHARGAFTGADAARAGLLAQADGGTLFLDEVADIPLPTQVKLLRALDYGEFVPVGGSAPVASDFRIISATHGNLLQRISEGSFRHDLYFRLCAFQICLPPLRDRQADIAELAEYFSTTLADPPGAAAPLSPGAIAELERRPWHGNVRELRNAVDHALVMSRGRAIMPEHLPPPLEMSIAGSSGDSVDDEVADAIRNWAARYVDDPQSTGHLYDQLLDVVEPPVLKAALDKHHGQCAAAARQLGIHRTTLRKKLNERGLDAEREAP